MKKCIVFMIFMMFSTVLMPTDLIDVYKKGPIKLIPDPEFGKNTDWGGLFFDFRSVSAMGKPIGVLKDITVADDGSIFISNYSQYNIFKFDKNGNFVKKFGNMGNKPGEFFWRPSSISILDNRYLTVRIYHGKIHLFDLDGNFVKHMQMDYPILECVALKDNKVGISGSVPYRGKQSKKLIAIKDVNTEKEDILTYYMEDYFKGREPIEMKTKDGNIGVISTPTFSYVHSFARRSLDGSLIVGYSDKDKITVYSPEGAKMHSFVLNIEPLEITEKIKQEYRESSRKSLERTKEWIQKMIEREQIEDYSEKIIRELSERPIKFPEHMPYYYNLIVDSDGNILIFLYTETNDIYKFQVYSSNGTYICESAIDPGEYKLKVYRNLIPIVFFNGDLFAVVSEKDNPSVPPRLIKVNLSENN
jgi:hypothetical protein